MRARLADVCSVFQIWTLLVLLNITVGTWSVIEIVSWIGFTIPKFLAGIIAYFIGPIAILIYIIGIIIKTLLGI